MSNLPSPVDDIFAENDRKPKALTPARIKIEKERCAADIVYFINHYCRIYDSLTSTWVPFTLWPAQVELLKAVMAAKYTLVPKARQLGISWLLCDVLPLYYMLFKPVAEILLFSQRDDEAMGLLGRIKATDELPSTYNLLPDWMKTKIAVDNSHEFKLGNGSRIQALPATAGGRSNTVTYVAIDEADFIPDLKSLITAAKPTIDAGNNKMVVLSTINEDTPNSYFQRLCTANADSQGSWSLQFLGWDAHPGRTNEWYDDKKASTLVDNGTLDPLYKEYPATLKEALAPRELNKRFPPDWIMTLSAVRKPVPVHGDMPAVPGLKIYKVPESGKRYGIGADPGGGKVDPSVAIVVNAETKELVAVLAGLIEPTQFANQVKDLQDYYFGAPVLFELNNHGYAFLSQAKERSMSFAIKDKARRGQSQREPGWLTTERSKHMLFDVGAKVMQELIALSTELNIPAEPILCDGTTIAELQSIEVSTLEAPEGLHDDHAMAWVLAIMSVYKGTPSMTQMSYTGLWHKTDRQEAHVPYMGPGGSTRVGTIADVTPEEKRQSEFVSKVVDSIVPRPDYSDGEVPEHIRKRFGRY